MTASVDLLRAELERLFTLDELVGIAGELLGLGAAELGGASAKGSFARALAERCVATDRAPALVDAIAHARRDVDPRLLDWTALALADEVTLRSPGDAVGPFTLGRRRDVRALGAVYEATRKREGGDGDAFEVVILHPERARDRRAVERWLTFLRQVGAVEPYPKGLPAALTPGSDGGIDWVGHRAVRGESLAALLERRTRYRFADLGPILRGVLEPLAALHRSGLAHGDLRLGNVFLDGPRADVVLVGLGGDRLGLASPSPETVLGDRVSPRSDVYAFGALVHELLTGRPPFEQLGGTGLRASVAVRRAHVAVAPEPPSARGAEDCSREVDALVLACMAKDPAVRPRDASAVLEAVERTLELEAARTGGGVREEPAVVGERLLAEAERAASLPEKKELLYRAGRVFDAGGLREPSERAFAAILALDPTDALAQRGLEQAHRASGKYEELVERLLARTQAAAPGPERARALAEIGRLYASELDDAEQAVVAFTQAVCEDPTNDAYAAEVERLCAANASAWTEQLEAIDQALASAPSGPSSRALARRAARWYGARLGQTSRALAGYQRVLTEDPDDEEAADAIADLHRRAQQWPELAATLLVRATRHESARSPRARELRAAAAEIFETKLEAPARARELYAAILEGDPGHAAAAAGMVRLAERAGDHAGAADVLDRLAEARTGAERAAALTQAAKVHAEHLDDLVGAARRYEAAVALEPASLEALAGLERAYEKSGRHRELAAVLEREVEVAPTPRHKVALYERLAALYEREFLDAASAAEIYDRLLALIPEHAGATEARTRRDREATAAKKRVLVQGERWGELAALLEREIDEARTDAAKVKLWTELARLRQRRLGDPARAEAAARRALELAADDAEARLVLADLAFDAGRLPEAGPLYEALAERPGALADEDALRVLDRAGRAAFADDPRRAYAHFQELGLRSGDALSGAARADVLYHLGESARRGGEPTAALAPLEEAARLAPSDARIFVALGRAASGIDDVRAITARRRALELGVGPTERAELSVEIGEALLRAGDRAGAAQAFSAALTQGPEDRNLLTRLMQLYSELEDWERVCEVVLRLAGFVEDPRQRAKYMHTAATIAVRSLGDVARGLDYYRRAIEFDPTLDRAISEALELRRERGEWEEVERLLKLQLEQTKSRTDRAGIAAALDALGDVYRDHLGEPDLAVDAYEAAAAFAPDRASRPAKLAALYEADATQYLGRAAALHEGALRRDPYRIESYKALRRVYAAAGRRDAAFCVCQALAVLRKADPEEEQVYQAARSRSAAPAKTPFDEDAWAKVSHPDLDPLVTRIFALLEPTMVRVRTRPIEELDYDPAAGIDAAAHPHPAVRTLYYAQGVLAIAAPLVFEALADPGSLGIVHAQPPAILVGRGAFERDVSGQAMAFFAGRHLASFRPGFYVRHLVPTGTGLRAWLFAAIRLVVPAFAIPPEIEAAVDEASAELLTEFGGSDGAAARDQLASLVAKVLQRPFGVSAASGGPQVKSSGALDLKKWVAAIDLTGDRVGFVLANDLQTSTEAIRATEKDGSVALKERMKEIVLFSVSAAYVALRETLGIAATT